MVNAVKQEEQEFENAQSALEDAYNRQAKRQHQLSMLSFFAAALAIFVGLASAGGLLGSYFGPLDPTIKRSALDVELSLVRAEIDDLKSNVYAEGEPVKPMDSGRVTALEDKFKSIETALQSDTEKALSVPMLRQDFENLEKRYDSDSRSLEDRVDSLYNVLLWMIGAFVTLSLAAIGYLASHGNRIK